MQLDRNKLQQMDTNNTITKTVVLRLYPDQNLKDSLYQLSGNERFVWNKIKDYVEKRHKENPDLKAPSRFDLNLILKDFRKEYPFLKLNDSTGLQKVIEQYHVAFKNVLNYYKELKKGHHPRKTGFPKYRSKKNDKLGFGGKVVNRNTFVVDLHHVKIPKFKKPLYTSSTIDATGWKIKEYRVILKRTGNYYLYLFVEGDNQALPHTGKMVGIDRNLKNLAVLSDGKQFRAFNWNHVRRLAHLSIVYQRKMSRALDRAKKIMAREEHEKALIQHDLSSFKNYWYYRKMFNRYCTKLERVKKDYLEHVANYLIENYDVIVFEKLNIKGLVKNHYVARSIMNSGWGQLYQIVQYKALWNNKLVVMVPASYTTQDCHSCGFRMGTNDTEKLTLNQRDWVCPNCGVHQRRDQNAALNILNRFLEKPNHYLNQLHEKYVNPANIKKTNECAMWAKIIKAYRSAFSIQK